MIGGCNSSKCVLFILLTILHRAQWVVVAAAAICEYSFIEDDKRYNYNLASPLPHFPHGVLSEDGFYKVALNETLLWFQLCDGMIFNHDQPRCVGCLDCGGPSRCGSECTALVAENIGGYPVCTALGQVSGSVINIMDKKNPHKGVIVKMASNGTELNCSLSVSVNCDSNAVQGPQAIEKSGTCNYSTVLRHPSGCAKIISVDGRGWGWFGTFLIVILCLFGGYLLAGSAYRYFALGVRGVDVIPNLEFWARAPHRTRSFFASLVRRFRGPSEGHRSTYSRVNF